MEHVTLLMAIKMAFIREGFFEDFQEVYRARDEKLLHSPHRFSPGTASNFLGVNSLT